MEHFERLTSRLLESKFEKNLKDTMRGLDDDDQEEMDSYLGKYLLDVSTRLS